MKTPLVALALALAACATSTPGPASTAPHPDVKVADEPTPRVLKAPDGGFHDYADAPMPGPADLPGYPLDDVLPSIAKQILAFSKDAFSYDGCSTSLQQCLVQPDHQGHALRMLALATRLAAAGANNTDIDTQLNKYYAGFGTRQTFTVDAATCGGPEDAKVTLVEFSDFECPFCAMARPLVESLVTQGGPVRLCFKPFPLGVHAHSQAAAQTALFAAAHGQFWPMHDLLFDHQDALENADLDRYASSLGLDPAGLEKALELHVFQGRVDASKAEGKAAKITGTPSIFINGRSFDLPMTAENLRHAIDDEVEWVDTKGTWQVKK